MIDPVNAYYIPRRRAPGERPIAPRTPAGRIVRMLGGVATTAEMGGVTIKTVYRWLATVADKGTGGRVPAAAQDRLIAAARAKGFALVHADFAPKPGEAFT